MLYNLGNLKIPLICGSVGFIVSIIYSRSRSKKISNENEILIKNAAKQWVKNEKKRVQKRDDI